MALLEQPRLQSAQLFAFLRNVGVGVTPLRRIAVAAGVFAVLALAFVAEGITANRIALAALLLFAVATAAGWIEFLLQGRDDQAASPSIRDRSRKWQFVIVIVAISAALTVQTWIRRGSTIAGGDLVVPNGTAWIAHLFEPWTWGGSTLGEPSQLPLTLPWAATVTLVGAVGGDTGFAQGVWYTLLFVGSGLAALGLLAALKLGPVASLTGAAVYIFNPYVITWVNTYDPYMVALFLLAALPALIVAAGTGSMSLRSSTALIALSSPLLGYAFLNPPLVGMILGLFLFAPLIVAWVDGRQAGARSLRALLFATPLLISSSAYWAIPATLHLASGIPSWFFDLGWTFVEGRASIRNALWVNTHWLWNYAEYFPYAGLYETLPFSIARFALPAIAFSGLAIATRPRLNQNGRLARLAVAASTLALFVIVLSTGTNFPGNALFLALYRLPYGWLLREPARFLMLVGLAYSVLIATTIAALQGESLVEVWSKSRARWPMLRFAVGPASIATVLLVGFPLYSGGFVPDGGPTLAPWAVSSRPTHVQMPTYWTEMARMVDAAPVKGGVLVLPPDDWYEMPYTWYYGTDAFVVQLVSRHVVLPTSQAYTPASVELTSAVRLLAASILRRDWQQVESVAAILDTPLILVRGDIQAQYPNHSIVAPGELSKALGSAPNFGLLKQVGPLELFGLRTALSQTQLDVHYAMINTRSPDLRILGFMQQGSALVTGDPERGTAYVVQSPDVETWRTQGESLSWHVSTSAGWTYRIADLNSQVSNPLTRGGAYASSSGTRIQYSPQLPAEQITVTLQARTVLSDGDFATGLWEPVRNCGGTNSDVITSHLEATLANVSSTQQKAVRISAANGLACETRTIDWHGGPVILDVLMHSVKGGPPRICLFEVGRNTCAALPPIPSLSGWFTYAASVNPDAGTTALAIYLYADATTGQSPTVAEYANVHVRELAGIPSLAVIAEPDSTTMPQPHQLALVHNSYSSHWRGSTSGKHVLVDGLLNGWLIAPGTDRFTASYDGSNLFWAGIWISLAALGILLVLLGSIVARISSAEIRRRFTRERSPS